MAEALAAEVGLEAVAAAAAAAVAHRAVGKWIARQYWLNVVFRKSMQKGAGKLKELSGWASLHGQWLRRKHYTPEVLSHIAERIKKGEQNHSGELMVAIEAIMPSHERDSHQRALEVFGRLRVWDTPLNSGVLLYLSLDKRRIEIIADRGLLASADQWAQVCKQLQLRLAQHDYVAGLIAAVDEIEGILSSCAPALAPGQLNPNDLPDEPVLL